ncbi:MAG: HDOD domain-containing protein [Planctomycetes bacterium]|nr:HDOD domain-containing protein [Planctomycetota bacterium]
MPEELEQQESPAEYVPSERVKRRLQTLSGVGILKAHARELIALRRNEDATYEDLLALLRRNGALAAIVFFKAQEFMPRLEDKPETLADAVYSLRLPRAQDVIEMIGVPEILEPFTPSEVSAWENWFDHTYYVANVASKLASLVGAGEESAYLAGLIHDVGAMMLVSAYPDLAKENWHKIIYHGIEAHIWEQETFGTHHAQFGGLVASEFGVKRSITEILVNHHDYGYDFQCQNSVIVMLADDLVKMKGHGKFAKKELVIPDRESLPSKRLCETFSSMFKQFRVDQLLEMTADVIAECRSVTAEYRY